MIASIQPHNLSEILGNRRWLRTHEPFPYIFAREVFREEVYRDMQAAFQAKLALGYGAPSETERFARNLVGYDAYSVSFVPEPGSPFHLFVSRPWHDMLASLLGVNATGDINFCLHHHSKGSAHGNVHNDFNPGWFVDSQNAEGINVWHAQSCRYSHGQVYQEGTTAHETIRAIAMLFYLNNPAWAPGDGGETGLYRSAGDSVEEPTTTVPPFNNSLLIFECTPYSYHSFLCNRRYPRNSVMMWLHRPKAEAVARWGESRIIHW